MALAVAPAASALLGLVLAAGRTVTLEEAQRSAEINHPQIKAAHARTEAGDAQTEQARAPVLPQVKVGALYERITGNRVQRPGTTRVQNNSFTFYNFYDATVVGHLILWDFGQTINRWRAAEQHAAALGDSARSVRLQVVVGVRAAFFRARAEKALVEVAKANLTNEERHLQQVQGFVEAGARPEIDLAQARSMRAHARLLVIEAETAYVDGRASLNQAMGVTGGTDYDVADQMLGPVDGEDAPVDTLVTTAMRARPDVAAIDAEVRAQELGTRAARGAYFPTLSLVAGASDTGLYFRSNTIPGVTGIPAPHGLAWNMFAGLELTWPIFQGFLTRGQVREADAQLSGVQAQREGLVNQIWVAVQQSAQGVRAAKEALVAAGEVVTAARERLRLAEGRYAAGAGSIIELGDAQSAFTSAAAQQVGAEYQLAAARADLAVALGMQ